MSFATGFQLSNRVCGDTSHRCPALTKLFNICRCRKSIRWPQMGLRCFSCFESIEDCSPENTSMWKRCAYL